jgi:hypothetical protein
LKEINEEEIICLSIKRADIVVNLRNKSKKWLIFNEK